MYRRMLASTVIAMTTVLPLMAAARPSSAATIWVPTATRSLSLVNATAMGALPSATPLHIAVALRLRNRAALDQYIRAITTSGSPSYGRQLTSDQFAVTYGPLTGQAQAVAGYLTSRGLTNVQTEPNRLFVTANGTAAQVEAAFNTQLTQYRQQGRTVFANVAPAQVPATLGGIVLSVLGLNDAVVMQSPIRHATLPVPQYLVSYNPQGFWKAYDVASTPPALGTSVAIFTEGNVTGVINDLRTEERANTLPQVPVRVVQVGLQSPDTSGADEWDMDTQYSTGMAARVSSLYLYNATSLADVDLALAFNRFAAQRLARAASASFGGCEFGPYLDGSMLADDEVFAEAAAQGQTVFASAGDTGGFCSVGTPNGVPAGVPNTEYPASSPYVVAVGGTTLLTNSDGTYNKEIAWVAGGGGQDVFEVQPFWQAGVVPTGTSNVGKALPDIAMDADPESGANVFVNCQSSDPYGKNCQEGVGGTSLSSPLALGVWARLETSHGNRLGFAAPSLYRAYQTAGFHDIILGDTGPYPATPGWDFATGLGTFDVAQMNRIIR